MSFNYEPIDYDELSGEHKENYNYHKVCALLVEYGFSTQRLNDDWEEADFIAQHADTNTFLKIQLKGRLTFAKKYLGKDLYIAFPADGDWYVAPHDELLTEVSKELGIITNTSSWKDKGAYSFPRIGEDIMELITPYRVPPR